MKPVWLLVAALLIAGPATAADLSPQLVRAGFALERPEPAAARDGAYDKTVLTIYGPSLAFWVDVSQVQAGDHLVLSLKSPDGGIMAARDIPFDLARERFFAFTSAKRPERGWKRGPYIGNAQIVRGDQILLEQTNQIALP